MIIQRFFLESFVIKNRIFRKGLILHLEGNNGRKTSVEISPLPGFSKETLEDAKKQLNKIKPKITTTEWSKSALKSFTKMKLFPSVYFGIETGILDLLDPIKKEEEIQTYSLLFGSVPEIIKDALTLLKQGVKDVKIKLGHLNLEDAYEVIDSLVDHFSIRLDFNRKWDRKKTLCFCQKYNPNQFLYIEEPCSSPEDLYNFPYPYALDETLRDGNYQPYLDSPMLKKLILKPTITYPLSHFVKSKIPCVITSSFESATGINQLRRLIKRLGIEAELHGLDTLRYLC